MRHEVSAGGVVVRCQSQGPQVLISKHSGYHKWVLPKGLQEAGETLEETALREVSEEAGVVGSIICPLGEPETYTYTLGGEVISKEVHYFLMEYVSGDEQTHDFEMEEVTWVSIEDAQERMGYDGAKQVLTRAQQEINTRSLCQEQP